MKRLPASLVCMLCVALLHGLVYVFIVPPWQHYDEPNHFEYAWLIAHRGRLPQAGDYDWQMRQDVAASMLAAGFFDALDFRPDLKATDRPAWIGGYSQLGDPPVYYMLAALPVWLSASAGVTTQLYAARLLSLGLYLVTVTAAWGLARDLVPAGSRLRWLVPLTLALVPSFADLMTAVNSDVAAVACFSLFLWAGVRSIQRGFAWRRFVAALLAVFLCLGIKSNVFVAAPLLVPVLLFALLRGSRRRLAWMALAASPLLAIAAVFRGGEPAHWYRQENRAALARLVDAQALSGQYVFMVETSASGAAPARASRFWQAVPPHVLQPLEGQVLTLGAWAWASRPVQVSSPSFHVWGGNLDFARDWSLDIRPTFHSFTFTLPVGAHHGWIGLLPLTEQAGAQVYWDGLVLAAGERPGSPPTFDNPDGRTGSWGTPFENLLRGASAEGAWPGVRPWVDALSERVFPDGGRFSFILYTLLDWRGTGWYYRAVMANLLRTFWARFGWGNVGLAFGRPYLLLAVVTAAGLAGALLSLFRQHRRLPWAALFFLGLSAGLVWGFTFVRGSIYLVYQAHFIPAARYAYPVVIPTVLVLVAGWAAWGRFLRRLFHISPRGLVALYVLFFFALDVFSVVSIARFYAR
ncbi:MAG: DUF2142 domain-containing protein [Chloroflexota bacterium]